MVQFSGSTIYRRGARVATRYCGSGEFAELLADLDAAARNARELARLEADTHKSRISERERTVKDLCRAIGDAVGAVLTSLGYHQHKRQWRKRRMPGPSTTLATRGDASPLVAVGNLAVVAIEAGIRSAAGNDAGFARSLRAQVAQLQRELVGPDPSPLERLLGERVALCWLQLHQAELLVADASRRSLPGLVGQERRRDQAHRRYLQSIKALAQIRRLALLSLVQVNIGEQQVIAPNGINGKAPVVAGDRRD